MKDRNRDAHKARRLLAFEHAKDGNRYGVVFVMAFHLCAGLFGLALWISVGIGVANAASLSLWWGPGIGVALTMTLGRAWRWWRRPQWTEVYEDVAAG